MFLRQLTLEGFRNYLQLGLEFGHRKVILLGDNAQGKTNLLEAIATLSTGQSPFVLRDAELVRWGEEQAIVRAVGENPMGAMAVDLLFKANGRRAIRVNGAYVRQLSELRGKIPSVLFSSQDLELVRGSPGDRRAFLDGILRVISVRYHEAFARYAKVLQQRNSYLKEERPEEAQLAVWDDQLVRYGTTVMQLRAELVGRLSPLAGDWHARISGNSETLSLAYLPSILREPDEASWRDRFMRQLQEGRHAELGRRQSLWGPHRDDLALAIDARDARAFASQGQRRTIVLALKLAELGLMKVELGEAPLLLLDDVLAELDVRRQNHLLAAIGSEVQVFVTSTHLSDFAADWIEQAEIHVVREGMVRPFTTVGS